ncbi:hypothetical protein MRX96_045146 [Rhipicephalus microplus]
MGAAVYPSSRRKGIVLSGRLNRVSLPEASIPDDDTRMWKRRERKERKREVREPTSPGGLESRGFVFRVASQGRPRQVWRSARLPRT